jgi:hypothetical protein
MCVYSALVNIPAGFSISRETFITTAVVRSLRIVAGGVAVTWIGLTFINVNADKI